MPRTVNLQETIGWSRQASTSAFQSRLHDYLNLKFAARGFPIVGDPVEFPFLEMGQPLIANFQERLRLLSDHLCPVDAAIEGFLRSCLAETGVFGPEESLVPGHAFVLERHGLARMLSLPAGGDLFESSIVSSYRVHQGVCHNPKSDRRTTQGVFHVTEGGFPIPADKKAVPKVTFAHLLKAALHPPRALMTLPFTANQPTPAEVFVSLMLRPLVCPAVPGVTLAKTMETRFFAPGNLVSNLDFVESIFGNAGDPHLPVNDARLDVDHWSGHTGCVILAPHLVTLTKKDVGLPHVSEATSRQKHDGMCWESPDELYNDGGAFKITCRDHRGVIVTLIADNYFGYCKKEVKTQLSYAANLLGLAEEEHAGGALAFPAFDLGEVFRLSHHRQIVDHRFTQMAERFGDCLNLQPEGFAIDKRFPDIVYVPEDVHIDLHTQRISWTRDGQDREIRLQPGVTYLLPSGYKVEMVKPSQGQRWRLIGTNAEGTLCHKPCTVSGGGKSEISKSLADAMETGPILVPDFANDMRIAQEVTRYDFSKRFQRPIDPDKPGRGFLDPSRSLGSAIRLLAESPEYTEEYNTWVRSLPRTVRDLCLTIKRFWKEDWGDDWARHFHVDSINGQPGFELKYRNNKLVTTYLRIGFHEDGSWRTFGLRKDFYQAAKLQREDDITASITVPAAALSGLHPDVRHPSLKFIENCEFRLFQRPDDAIHRGYDKTTESDFSKPGHFFSNFEPITRAQARAMTEDTIRFGKFTEPLRQCILDFIAAERPEYMVVSSEPRLVGGKPTKNPRYLQDRPDLAAGRAEYLAELGARLYRDVPFGEPLPSPVNAVLPGRRNNPAEPGIRPLAVFNPIHYQELPELFMDFISSLTGKSPSTTGAGSEGALTKSPFNALPPIIDLNNALVSYLLTEYPAYSSAAGYIGRRYRVDHDISLIIPEVWSRMFIPEREPRFLLEKGYLEPVRDFEHDGRKVLASRLGFRITESFVHIFFGRVFNDPATLFPPDMLRPELQDLGEFVDGIDNIVQTQQAVAMSYFNDGSIEMACPPLRALLHIMAHGHYEGKDAHDPEFRALFTREALLASDWYPERLRAKLTTDRNLRLRQIVSLRRFLAKEQYHQEASRLGLPAKLAELEDEIASLENQPEAALWRLQGTIGCDPAVLRSS